MIDIINIIIIGNWKFQVDRLAYHKQTVQNVSSDIKECFAFFRNNEKTQVSCFLL